MKTRQRQRQYFPHQIFIRLNHAEPRIKLRQVNFDVDWEVMPSSMVAHLHVSLSICEMKFSIDSRQTRGRNYQWHQLLCRFQKLTPKKWKLWKIWNVLYSWSDSKKLSQEGGADVKLKSSANEAANVLTSLFPFYHVSVATFSNHRLKPGWLLKPGGNTRNIFLSCRKKRFLLMIC